MMPKLLLLVVLWGKACFVLCRGWIELLYLIKKAIQGIGFIYLKNAIEQIGILLLILEIVQYLEFYVVKENLFGQKILINLSIKLNKWQSLCN